MSTRSPVLECHRDFEFYENVSRIQSGEAFRFFIQNLGRDFGVRNMIKNLSFFHLFFQSETTAYFDQYSKTS